MYPKAQLHKMALYQYMYNLKPISDTVTNTNTYHSDKSCGKSAAVQQE